MGHDEVGLVDRLVSVEQEIEVDRARPEAGAAALPPERVLDPAKAVEESAWRERRVHGDGRVQKARLRGVPDGIGVAKARDGRELDLFVALESLDRPLQVRPPVADVTPETYVHPHENEVRSGDGSNRAGAREGDRMKVVRGAKPRRRPLPGAFRRRARAGLAGVLLTALALAWPSGAAARPANAPLGHHAGARAWVEGEILVRFRRGASIRERMEVNRLRGASLVRRIRGLGVEVVKLPPRRSVQRAVAAYRRDPRVAAAEPDYLRRTFETRPNDPEFGKLWALRNVGQRHPVADSTALLAGLPDADIDASDAWSVQTGVSTTVIAVIDNGFAVGHPDLDGSLWTNRAEVPGNGADDDLNGKVDDVHGWDFANDDSSLADAPSLHGTHVAGTIAAEMGNGIGVAGVCPGCRLMLLKVGRSDGTIALSSVLGALAYARAEGADVVNLSLGGPTWSNLEREAIRTGRFLAVAAAGNESLDNDMYLADDRDGDGEPDVFSPSYPASYNLANLLSVAASTHTDEYGYATGCRARGGSKPACAFTSWGHDSVDVAAPGVDILSTAPGSRYKTLDGTSMAAPHVAGIAGLVKSQNPADTPVQVKNRIMRSVDRPTSLRWLPTQLFLARKYGRFTRTSGRVNAAGALAASSTSATRRTDGNIDGARAVSTPFIGSVAWPRDVNDVYRRKFYAGRRYRVSIDGPAGKDFDLFLWRPGTKEIWETNSGCPGGKCLRVSAGGTADEAIAFKAPTTGVYYVHVSAWLLNGGRYTLRIRRL